MPFFSHSIPDKPLKFWPYVHEHLAATASKAEEFASAFGSGAWAFLCGLLHDLGKYSLVFQKRLLGGEKVDHSLAGALEAINFLKSCSHGDSANLLAHIISGHHTGLADGVAGETDDLSLNERLRKKDAIPDYSAWRDEIALPEGKLLLPEFTRTGEADLAFNLCFWTRMIYSCLVDADFLHTESVKAPEKSAQRGEYPALAALQEPFNAYIAKKPAEVEKRNVKAAGVKWKNVIEQRAKVLAACREAALWKQGLFSLTVPTGGGKTLSSLAFALDHAAEHSLHRIIYVIPYTSIIEQTVDVFREAFGADLAYAVIEHHSNAEEKPEKDPKAADHHEDARTLAYENWDASIIVTTAVQFFESLFAAHSSRCRKLHNIAGSVIILDEAQTLPTPLFRPCLAAIRELSDMYRASVVLCTATQPEVGIKPWNRNGLEGVREIVPDPPALFRSLERVRVEYLGTLDPPALAQRLAGHERVLCIVNTREQARDLCKLLKGLLREGQTLFHLSTRMCPAHRKAVLARIRSMLLDQAAPLVVVSTSLIEAGVDLDFPIVYRAMVGVDSIAQAAGRNNREGLLDWGYTYVFSFPDPLGGEQARRKSATEAVLRAGLPLLSPEAVTMYFDELHSMVGPDGLDRPKILRRMREHVERRLFPFRSVERDFRFIEDYELPLIIPYNAAAREDLDTLRAGKADLALYRRLQQWTVGVPEEIMRALLGKSVAAVGVAGQHYELITPDLYDGLEGEKADAQEPVLGFDARNPASARRKER